MAIKRILPSAAQPGRSGFRVLADRTEEMIGEGTLAERPTATGAKRFYFATDENKLYYDKGTWIQISA